MSERPSQRLVVVGPTPPPTHGVSVSIELLLNALRSLGLLVAYLDTTDRRSLANVGRFDLINVLLGLKHAWGLAALLTRNRGASVYLPIAQSRWGLLRDALFVAVARLFGRTLYLHLHGGGLVRVYADADPVLRFVIRWAFRSADQVWALTPGIARGLEGMVPDGRLRVVENVASNPNGISTSRSGGKSGDRGARQTGTFRVLHISNLIPEKGCLDLLDAISYLADRAAGWHITIAGDTYDHSFRRFVERRAREVSGPAAVEILPALEGSAKREALGSTDAFVLPTRYQFEGQPLVILEAMASGVAIVATRHAGIPETVRDGKEALLVPPANSEAIGSALERIAADANLRSSLGRAARERYERSYRPERLVEDLAALLRSPPSAPRGRGGLSSVRRSPPG